MRAWLQHVARERAPLLLLFGLPAILGFVSTPLIALRWHRLAGVSVGSSLVVLTLVLVIGYVGDEPRARF